MESVIKLCRGNNIEYRTDVSMSRFTTFKTGGKAKAAAFPSNEREIADLIKICKATDTKYYIIGKGSNVLVADSGINGLVIFTGEKFNGIRLRSGNIIEAQSGAPLSAVCGFALENSLTGLEFAWGIPGTVGGAACMNAGAYGGEMSDILKKTSHIDGNGNAGAFTETGLKLSYRKSVYTSLDYCVTGVFLQMAHGSREQIKAKMDDILSRRKQKQPLEFPSAGSVFKRPEGYYAAALIEECGLKGARVRNAEVSEKHAGFIINTGGAVSADIIELIDIVKKTVYNKKGINLELEIKII
ncbi:MAG: UDP-N-acetylmuramate dehydrogenase [Oscillospiraceae bacterium]|nr:UDP-N-acetylmuramate dehydrogenase [Oscillospiraceae bacterium]